MKLCCCWRSLCWLSFGLLEVDSFVVFLVEADVGFVVSDVCLDQVYDDVEVRALVVSLVVALVVVSSFLVVALVVSFVSFVVSLVSSVSLVVSSVAVVVSSVCEVVVVVSASLELSVWLTELDLSFFDEESSLLSFVKMKIAPIASADAISMITAVIRTSDFFIEHTP